MSVFAGAGALEERIKAVQGLEEPDCVPVSLDIDAFYITWLVGLTTSEYFQDPRKMLKAQLKVRKVFLERFGIPMVVWPNYGCVVEAEALGCKVRWAEDGVPWVEKPVIERKEDADNLEVPNPFHAEPMATILKTCEFMKREVGDRIPISIGGGSHAPFTLAALIRGASKFYVDLYTDPTFAHRLLAVATETVITWQRAMRELVPLSDVWIGDDHAQHLSPAMYEVFALPYVDKVYSSLGGTRILHMCGESAHLWEILADKLHVDSFEYLGWTVDIGDAKRRIGDRVCLMGNINPTLLKEGPPRMIREAAIDCIMKAAPGGGYILSIGGEVLRGTPLEHIGVLVKVAKKYGTYPLKIR